MFSWLKQALGIQKKSPYPFRDSALAHALLDGKKGIEIGASAHNPFNIEGTTFVDFTDDTDTPFKKSELELMGHMQRVDVVATAWELPFENESQQFVLSSHVLEHCFDVIGTMKEWFRVLEPGGLVFMIIPHMDRTFDKDEDPTPVEELVERHAGLRTPIREPAAHHSFWRTEGFLALCKNQGWHVIETQDVDDKAKNGFTVVLRKQG